LVNKQYNESSKVLEAFRARVKNKLDKEVLCNYGNVLKEEAKLPIEIKLDETIKLFHKIIDFFSNAIELDENFSNAKYNFEIIKNHQDELKECIEKHNQKNQNL
jgi:hypothetical protein